MDHPPLPRLLNLPDNEIQGILAAAHDAQVMQAFNDAVSKANTAEEAYREAQWEQGLLKTEMDRRLEASRAQHPLQQFMNLRGIKPAEGTQP